MNIEYRIRKLTFCRGKILISKFYLFIYMWIVLYGIQLLQLIILMSGTTFWMVVGY